MENKGDSSKFNECQVRLHNDLEHEIHGAGERKLVFIPGLMCDRAIWRYQIEHVLESEPNCEILTINNYGMSREMSANGSRSYLDRFNMSMYADDVKCLIDHYGWQRVTVIGISMGGMIALRFAVKYPLNTASLVLVNTHSGGFSGIPKLSGILGIAKHVICPGDATYFESIYGHTEKTVNERVVKNITSEYDVSHVSGHNINKLVTACTQIVAIFTHYITQAEFKVINEAKIPSLIVTGMNDNIIDPKASLDIYQNLENSELFIVKDSGHGLILEDHGEDKSVGHTFNIKLTEFIKHVYNNTCTIESIKPSKPVAKKKFFIGDTATE
ncbi:hypothetical protein YASMINEVIRUS_610 [Yasminevirus sp. GU-2018]|uniref:AB hydrolase-1 domain-containing protein n=1 Tax=Yasminevirus sp. GU-2018 TaxID=2420051 RepID=A0A5K0U8E7_9VIRU|nr:hypothetical protein YASMINEVIRUS_610 [Yasminevirus sp. GU-2018]